MDHQFQSQSPSDTRLDSWKEIAAFFGRDERTVKRWEKERGLPVHRLPGKGKGGVFAYARELDDWLGVRGTDTDISYLAPARARGILVALPSSGAPPLPSAAAVSTAPDARGNQPGYRWSNIIGSAAGVAALILIAAAFIRQERATPIAGNSSMSRATSTPTPAHAANPEAEDMYLKGRYYWNKRTSDSLTQAVDYFTQAIVRDPNFAPAYAGLADSYNLMREFSNMPDSEAFPRAIAAAKKAVELDDSLSEAHRTLAFDYFWGAWDFPAAEREFKRAIELNPDDVEAYHWRATSFVLLQKFDQATADIDRARELDPSSISIVADRAYVIFPAGHREESISTLLQLEKTDPSFRSPSAYLCTFYLQEKDWPHYLEQMKKSAALANNQRDLALYTSAESVLHESGWEKTLRFIAEKTEARFLKDPTTPIPDPAIFADIGDQTRAMHYLQVKYDRRDLSILFMGLDPAFNTMHDEPAFRALIAKIGLPPVN